MGHGNRSGSLHPSGPQKKRLGSPTDPCFHGTRCETPLAFRNLLRFSAYLRKFFSSASPLERSGA